MTQRVVVRLVRPYTTEEEFLEAEGWTLGSRGMLLLEQEPLDAGTPIRCDVSLEGGERLVRAEGDVIEFVPADGDRPAVLKVRFKRMSPATQELLKKRPRRRKATTQRPKPGDPPASSGAAEADPSPAEAALAAPPEPAIAEAEVDPDTEGEAETEPEVGEVVSLAPPSQPTPRDRGRGSRRPAPAGVRSVQPPPNRDELLEKLRERYRRLSG